MLSRFVTPLAAIVLLIAATAGAGLTGTTTQLSSDAAWTWFNDPRALYDNGRIVTGWMNQAGEVIVGVQDVASHQTYTATLATPFQQDDHDNPAFIRNGANSYTA